MRLKQNYPLSGRIKVFLILFFVLLIMGMIAYQKHEKVKQSQSASMEKLLQKAFEPMGSTMYIWGGGWDDEDSAAGAGSSRIGLSPEWEAFAKQQDADYDFENYRYEREKGLDCSGYVGWVVYNTLETRSGKAGYVITSTDMAENYAQRGFGRLLSSLEGFLAGDIVSMQGHVWMSLGTCADGSVLLAHASPPGVSLCGTAVPADASAENTEKSIAVQLAEDFMTAYYPDWQEKYPKRSVSCSYLEDVSIMRWSTEVFADAWEWQQLSGEEVLERLTLKR